MNLTQAANSFRYTLQTHVAEGNLAALRKLLTKKHMPLQCPDPSNGWPLLFYAIRFNQNNLVEYMLDQGHEEKQISKDFNLNTALMIAAEWKNEVAFYMYVDRFPQAISMVNNDGKTALIIAVQKGLNGVVTVLLDRGAQVNATDREGSTPLHHAAAYGHFDTVTLLMERGANINVANAQGWTPFDYAFSVDMRDHLQECALAIAERRPIKVNSLRSHPMMGASAYGQTQPKLDLRTLF
ncbi:hypothetical protein HK097_010356 [Rhizophlyctis rosea]|uniref:Uncharacterized protein n=1 Tax=Rhizophlyctis rosea TaxID=64517 RepID=A0AAD5S9A8_9FUNG|nr:hypothetical protein HK097_010356 [Rhizophlyctis rosea]